MSKLAKEAALKAYPIQGEWVGNQYGEWDSDINSPKRNVFQRGYEQGEKDTIERAIKWLIDRIDVPCSVATNEKGEPLADSYIDYAKKRLEAANKIVDEFRKAMEEE